MLNHHSPFQIEVLENARSLKFLGCFPNPQDSLSPCSKNPSLLFSCIHKKKKKKHRRSSSDENIYAPPQQPPTTDPYYDTDDTRSKDDIGGCSTEEDDDDYGFRKRPKTYYTDPNNRSREFINRSSGDFNNRYVSLVTKYNTSYFGTDAV